MNKTTLSKRTNILFSESTWRRLSKLSDAKNISIGELIRNAINEVYFSDAQKNEKKQAYDDILHMRPVIRGTIDYKALINEGRKY